MAHLSWRYHSLIDCTRHMVPSCVRMLCRVVCRMIVIINPMMICDGWWFVKPLYFLKFMNLMKIYPENNGAGVNINLCTPWWRHQMKTFSALLAIYAGNSSVTGEFPAQRPVTRSFGVFFDLLLNKRLSKQSWGWWFETPLCPLWRHCTVRLYPSSRHAKRCGCNSTMDTNLTVPNIRHPLLPPPHLVWFTSSQWRHSKSINLAISSSVNSVLPVRHQATYWTNILLTVNWAHWKNFNDILMK